MGEAEGAGLVGASRGFRPPIRQLRTMIGPVQKSVDLIFRLRLHIVLFTDFGGGPIPPSARTLMPSRVERLGGDRKRVSAVVWRPARLWYGLQMVAELVGHEGGEVVVQRRICVRKRLQCEPGPVAHDGRHGPAQEVEFGRPPPRPSGRILVRPTRRGELGARRPRMTNSHYCPAAGISSTPLPSTMSMLHGRSCIHF